VAKPHIGTFRLVGMVERMRATIESLGGEIRFGSRVVDLHVDRSVEGGDVRGQVRGVTLADGVTIEADHVVLAVGHSKGNLSIAVALGNVPTDQARVQYPRMAVVTFGALVELPQSLAMQRQYLGTLDGFGWMNSILPQPWIPVPWATHTLNTGLPFHVAAKTELQADSGGTSRQSPVSLEQVIDKLYGAMRPPPRSATQWQNLLIDAGTAFQGALTESWRSLLQGTAHAMKRQEESARVAAGK